jgi:phycobilisome core-membrane linker protein
VPCLRGLNSAAGIPLPTVNRTAALYAGNAGLNPSPREAI